MRQKEHQDKEKGDKVREKEFWVREKENKQVWRMEKEGDHMEEKEIR